MPNIKENQLHSSWPLVSVVTVCFNAKKTIQRTFDSIRKQTYSNIEYIVIDGCSNDGTVQLINDNSDLIDTLVSEPDDGIYDAMNKGISLSKGDFVVL